MYIDLTQTFTADMPVYPGDRMPDLKQIATIGKDGFADHEIKTSMHTGTHMDAPLHMLESGKNISEFDIEKFFGPGKLVDARGKKNIGPDVLQGIDIQAGDIVLVLTGFGATFRDPDYFENYPELTEEFANKLINLKVKMVGLDCPGPDRAPFLIHKILLGKEILILENLTNLELLLNKQFEVIALPLKLEAEASPARVVAIRKI